jgi:ABC-type polysaccharide/polyol phosphate export permease
VKALAELARMRLLLLVRQPEIVFWAFVFPVLLSMVLGLAFRAREDVVSRVGVLDARAAGERSPMPAGLAAALEEGEIELVERADGAALLEGVQAGALDAALVVDESGALTVRYDAGREASALAALRVEAALGRATQGAAPGALVAEPLDGRGVRYVDWFVPGLLGLSVMSTSIWAIGFAFVEARQKLQLKRFLVTPVKRSSFLFSFVLARCALLVFEVALLLFFARLVLHVPFRGSYASFFVIALVGALVFAGIGVLLGSRSRTPESAAGLINLTMMPMGLCSGVFFSYERFSEVLQPLIRLLPLTAFVDALRAVALEGAPLAEQGGRLRLLLLWGGLAFWVGRVIFRWK